MDVGGPVGVLRQSHSPYQAGPPAITIGIPVSWHRRPRHHARARADVLRCNPGDRRCPLRRVPVDHRPPVVIPLGPAIHEPVVRQTLRHHDVRHGVEQRHVRPRIRTQPQVGVVAHVNPARVDHDQLGSAFHHRPPHPRRRHRMVRRGIASHHHQAAGVLVVSVGVARRPAAQRGEHRSHRRRVAQPRAVVDVVAAHHQAGELLLHVAVFIGGLGGAQRSKSLAAIVGQARGHQVQRLIPRRLPKLAGKPLAFPDQRSFDAITVLHERVAKPALHAQHPDARKVVRIIVRRDNPARLRSFRGVADFQLNSATNPTVRTRRLDLVGWRPSLRRCFDADRPRGAHAQALPAGGADALGQRLVPRRRDARRPAGSQHVYRADELVAGLAGVHAPGAQDARVHRQVEHRVGLVRRLAFPGVPPSAGDAMQLGCVRQQTVPFNRSVAAVPVAHHAQGQLNHPGADALRVGRVGSYHHPVARRRRARCGKSSYPVDLNQAGPTRPDGRHVGVLAQLRQRNAGRVHGVQRACPCGHGDRDPVNRYANRWTGDDHRWYPQPAAPAIREAIDYWLALEITLCSE